MAVDGVSGRILLEDIERGCQQLLAGEPVKLSSKTSSYRRWAQQQQKRAQSAELLAQMEYWGGVIEKIDAGANSWLAARGEREEENTVEKARTVTVALEEAETRALLQQVPGAAHAKVEEVLLTALARVLGEGSGGVWVDLEGHGRETEVLEGVDVSRTVGWFTCLYPTWLPNEAEDPGTCLGAVKEELRRIPERGRGYGLARYVRGDAELSERLRVKRRPEVLFNYLGQLDLVLPQEGMLQAAGEYAGASRSSRQARSHGLEINAAVRNGQLLVNWTWASDCQPSLPVEQIAKNYIIQLRSLIQYCLATKRTHSPSDFPLAKIDQRQLDRLSARTAEVRVPDIG
jgi:non-ribosomal peptide synthase protein (TIGR01720 family)